MDEREETAARWDRWADVYDTDHSYAPDPTAAVAFLTGVAGDGHALELGVGTGRVAVPLAEAGVPVAGLDISPKMLDILRRRAAGRVVTAHLGDMADLDVPGRYTLVYTVWSTLYNLPDQQHQLDCFTGAAGVLTSDGRFVVEGFLPRFPHPRVTVRDSAADRLDLTITECDPAAQTMLLHEIRLGDGRVERRPVRIRYAWPAELDLMARLAGLRLIARHGGWDRRPFTGACARHVSVYGPR